MSEWLPIPFEKLTGWSGDDHLAAFSCFKISARALLKAGSETRKAIFPSQSLKDVARRALSLDQQTLNGDIARTFFETEFLPHTYSDPQGFVTGYFEPEIPASRKKSSDFSVPVYRKPEDLVKITEDNRPDDWPSDLEYGRRTDDGLVEYYDRSAITNGALANQGLELFWLKSHIEAFFVHIQGSARLIFSDGSSVRISYAGKTGHPYTSIGKLLVERGIMTPQQANMESLIHWLEADLDRAMEVLNQNRSYIFFTQSDHQDPEFGPLAAAGVQLTPGRSLAVDRTIHPYGTPIWLSTKEPLPSASRPFQRLMIAQDTGSAIVGPQRGDIFIGSGREAGMIAGSVRHETEFVAFFPRNHS